MKLRWPVAVSAVLTLSGCGPQSEVEDVVRRTMRDPDAAQFRGVGQCSGDRDVWHGEVNGKNAFGAYVGFKPFFASGSDVKYADDGGFTVLMDQCYSDLPTVDDVATTAAPVKAAGKTHYPYVAPDGVDIRNAKDEANWKRFGTTDPGGGE